MIDISVVIITKNEAANIKTCIECAGLISADIIVIDSDSTDSTVSIAKQAGANVINVPWQGYGYARNIGAKNAKNDWVLALDADEHLDISFADAVKNIKEFNPQTIYGCKWQNYFIGKKINFGEWGNEKIFRLYNKKSASWDIAPVHEKLLGTNLKRELISGYVNHYSITSLQQNAEKTKRYALLGAQKLHQKQRNATFVKRYLSPLFNFIKMYFFQLGFLDGKEGFIIAASTTKYVWLKYRILHQLRSDVKKNTE